MLVCVNVINGVINRQITINLSPAEAGDLNAYFELVVPAGCSTKTVRFRTRVPIKKLSIQSPKFYNRNFRTLCIAY